MLPLAAGIVAGVGALASAGASWYSAYKNNQNQEKAYDLNRENLAWQKQQWEETKSREDNAVQRRAADLEAAGLSKTLAAGSAASASSAPSLGQLSPAKYSAPAQAIGQALTGLADAISLKQRIDQTSASIDLTKQQLLTERANTQKALAEADYIHSRTTNTELDNAQREFYNGILSDRWGIEKADFERRLLDSASSRALQSSGVARNSWLQQLEGMKYTQEGQRLELAAQNYALDLKRYGDWRHNLLERLQMDKEMYAARMSLLSEQSLLTASQRDDLLYNLGVSKDAGVLNRGGVSPLGTLERDFNSTLLKALRGIHGR